MKARLIIALVFFLPLSAVAAEYQVDFGLVVDLEDIRPLLEGCSDIGQFERHRSEFESAGDLEDFRGYFENVGYGEFTGCPSYVEASGVRSTY